MKKLLRWMIRCAGVLCFFISLFLTIKWALTYWNIAIIFIELKSALLGIIKPMILMVIACTLCHISENILDRW